jgi:hypothetical protein
LRNQESCMPKKVVSILIMDNESSEGDDKKDSKDYKDTDTEKERNKNIDDDSTVHMVGK